MACPFFAPQEITEEPLAARLPLGYAWRGPCLAPQPSPASAMPLKLCNLGYARRSCASFPRDCEVDANRFAFAPSSGELLWIEEAGHAPLRFGPASQAMPQTASAVAQHQAFLRAVRDGKIPAATVATSRTEDTNQT